MSIKRREFCLFGPLQILLQHAAHREGRPGTEKQQDHRHRIRCQKNPRQQCGCNAQRTRQGTLRKTKRKQSPPPEAERGRLPRRTGSATVRTPRTPGHTARRFPAKKESPRSQPRPIRRRSPPESAPTKSRAGTFCGRRPNNPARAKPAHPARAFPSPRPAPPAPGLWSAPAGMRTEKVG